MAGEGVFPKSAGDIAYASEANDFYDDGRILQIYTGTGFNTSASSGTDNDTQELDDMTGISNGTYVKIEITVRDSFNTSTGTANSKIQIQTKDIGGSYSDTLPEQTVSSVVPNDADDASSSIITLIHYHTLTSDEKSAGIKIKILGESTSAGSGVTSQSNISTVVSLKV